MLARTPRGDALRRICLEVLLGVALCAAACAAAGTTTPPRALTPDAGPWAEGSCQNPTFSPDGRSLLFTRFTRGYNEGPSQIVRLDLATGVETVVMDGARLDADCVNAPGPSWIGGEIAFASDANLWSREPDVWVEELYVCADDGGSVTRLTYHRAGEGSCIEPVFDPRDPNHIVFTWEPPGEEAASQIGVLERNRGNRITILTEDEHLTSRIPNWSHDGGRIAWHRWDLRDPSALAQVFVAEVVFPEDGGPPRLAKERRLEQPHADNTDVSWLAGDRHVLTASESDAGVEVLALPVDGGPAVQLTHYAHPGLLVAAPYASPDGRTLVHELGEPARLVSVALPPDLGR